MKAINIYSPYLTSPSLRGKRSVEAISSRYLLLALLLLSSMSHAQQLNINDSLPTITINDLIKPNTPKPTTKDLYTDGALIISFWATWCTPCIKEMQLLAAEVDKYPGKLNVLSITYEDPIHIHRFLDQHPDIQNSGLHLIAGDTLFSKHFFHRALPHNVWVNQSGTIKAITGGGEVTQKNIAAFLSGSLLPMREKKEVTFDPRKPLQIPDSIPQARSIFLKRLPGVEMSGSSFHPGRMNRPVMQRFLMYNLRILTLFWAAHQMPGGADKSYLYEVHTRDSSRFFWPGEGKAPASYKGIDRYHWGKENTYTYEFSVTKPLEDSIFLARVRRDLEFNLHVKSRRELRPRDCYIVTYQKGRAPLKPAPSTASPVLKIEGGQLIFSGITIDYLLNSLILKTIQKEGNNRREPYLNQTGVPFLISGKVDIGTDPLLHRSREHLEACLNKALGLQFERQEAMYPILVLRDSL